MARKGKTKTFLIGKELKTKDLHHTAAERASRPGNKTRIKPPDSRSRGASQHRLMKTGGRLVKHARYYWLLLAEGHLNRRLFGDMLHRIWALPLPSG